MTGLLDGVRVVDLSRALAGPLAGSLLADFGADVIKVEPKSGDPARAWGPYFEGESLYATSVNRNKRSIAIDFRADSGMALVRQLVSSADVVIESFRPGVMAEMGLDPVDLKAANPKLVVVSISGFGSVGPYKNRPGLDQVLQGMSGLMSVTGENSEHIVRVGVPIVDFMTGVHAALAAAIGLAGVGRTGHGSHLETSLLETSLSSLVFQAQQYLSTGVVPLPRGNEHPTISPYGLFATGTRPITIAVGTEAQWRALAELVGRADLLTDPLYATATDRMVNRAALKAELETQLRSAPGDEWLDKLRALGIPSGPVNTVEEVFNDPQVEALGIVQESVRDDGFTTDVLTSPFRVDGERPPLRAPAPALGRHGAEVLLEAGLTAEEIVDLQTAGVVG